MITSLHFLSLISNASTFTNLHLAFIASHDLSVPETDPMNTGLNREMTVGDLENVDLNASSTAAGQPSRREVLGLDYL